MPALQSWPSQTRRHPPDRAASHRLAEGRISSRQIILLSCLLFQTWAFAASPAFLSLSYPLFLSSEWWGLSLAGPVALTFCPSGQAALLYYAAAVLFNTSSSLPPVPPVYHQLFCHHILRGKSIHNLTGAGRAVRAPCSAVSPSARTLAPCMIVPVVLYPSQSPCCGHASRIENHCNVEADCLCRLTAGLSPVLPRVSVTAVLTRRSIPVLLPSTYHHSGQTTPATSQRAISCKELPIYTRNIPRSSGLGPTIPDCNVGF